jgi:carboxylate-amine ligase
MQSSVSEHRFGAGPPFTLGVEEEYMLLDPASLDLVDGIEPFLLSEVDGEFASSVSCELFQSVVEVQTPICETVAELERELTRLRRHVAERAATLGVRFASAGTHPFALFEQQHVTRRPRYRDVMAKLQYPARRELIFGLHIHIGMPSPDAAIRVLDAFRVHLGELVALSASSPFWRGEPTGLASTRHAVFATFPRAGVPPHFVDYADFARAAGALEEAGYVEDYTRLWWDVRPHPRFGTLEVRVCDAVPRAEDALALAAYVQALAKCVLEEGGDAAVHDVLVDESKWQAIRHGLDADVLTAAGVVPAREAVARTLERIAPHADELGGDRHLAHVEWIVEQGNSAERQLELYQTEHDVTTVVAALAAESESAAPAAAAVGITQESD